MLYLSSIMADCDYGCVESTSFKETLIMLVLSEIKLSTFPLVFMREVLFSYLIQFHRYQFHILASQIIWQNCLLHCGLWVRFLINLNICYDCVTTLTLSFAPKTHVTTFTTTFNWILRCRELKSILSVVIRIILDFNMYSHRLNIWINSYQ